MKIKTILILTLMISSAICKDETDGKQERSDRGLSDAAPLGALVIFGIGIVFVMRGVADSKITNASLSDLVVDSILDCPICQQLLFAPVTLNCSHNFCQHCIGEWIEKQEGRKTCPFCREMIQGEYRVYTLDKILEKVESEIDEQKDKNQREEQKKKHSQFMESRQKKVEILEPLVNPFIETATTWFVVSNGQLFQARIQFDSGHGRVYREGVSGFDTFCNVFNSDQDYRH